MTSIEDENEAHIDDLLDALASKRRRQVLYYLRTTDGRARIDDLVCHLAERNYVDEDHLRADLRHSVLPKLTDVGLIRYDRRKDLVESDVEELADSLLDRVSTIE